MTEPAHVHRFTHVRWGDEGEAVERCACGQVRLRWPAPAPSYRRHAIDCADGDAADDEAQERDERNGGGW